MSPAIEIEEMEKTHKKDAEDTKINLIRNNYNNTTKA